MVGILWAWNLAWMRGLWSTSTLTILRFPAYFTETFSKMGATIRHGGHQGAHRSTMTGSFVSTAEEKSPSVASTNQGSFALQ